VSLAPLYDLKNLAKKIYSYYKITNLSEETGVVTHSDDNSHNFLETLLVNSGLTGRFSKTMTRPLHGCLINKSIDSL
jgi:hypothetical protein